jgi:ABC-type polysaccharide/polyol phosphate export permease
LMWRFFSEATNNAMLIFRKKRYLIQNVGIDKIDLIISASISSLLGLVVNFSIYFLLSIIFGVEFSWHVFYFPLLVLNMMIIVLSVSMVLSVVSVYLKDIRHLWDLVLLLGLWVTPIFYGKSVVLKKVPFLSFANPLSGIFINMRNVIVYAKAPDMFFIFYDFLYAVILFFIAYLIFNRLSPQAAEKL